MTWFLAAIKSSRIFQIIVGIGSALIAIKLYGSSKYQQGKRDDEMEDYINDLERSKRIDQRARDADGMHVDDIQYRD